MMAVSEVNCKLGIRVQDMRSTRVDSYSQTPDTSRRLAVGGRHGDTVGDRNSGFWILESRRAVLVRVGAVAMGGRVDRGSRVGSGGAQSLVADVPGRTR